MNRTLRLRGVVAGLAATALVGAGLALATAVPTPAAAAVTAPGSLSPDDGAGNPPFSTRPARKVVALSWSAVADATSYLVEVGTDASWSSPADLSLPTVATSLTLPVWLPHASYVWRVAALSGKAQGPWSANAEFTRGWRDVPSPISPSSGQAVTGRPTFSWTPVATASAYELQVSTSPDFPVVLSSESPDSSASPGVQQQARPATNTCFTERTRMTPFTERLQVGEDNAGACLFSVLGTGSTVYWRVRTLDRYVGAAGTSDTTPASSAGISHQPPVTTPGANSDLVSDCPTGTTSSPTPTATATATATPSGTASPTSTASPTGSASATPSATATPTASAVPAGETGTGGCAPTHPAEFGEWSTVTPFSATYPGPVGTYSGLPVTTLPLAGDGTGLCTDPDPTASAAPSSTHPEHALCSEFPTLRWNAAPGATRYRLYIALTDNYDNIQRIIETSALEWTPTDAWRNSSPALSYFYAVQPCDPSGCGEVTSSPPSFRKASPATGLLAPTGGNFTGDVPLSWQDYASTLSASSGQPATSEAYAYHLQVTTTDDPGFSAPVEEATVDETTYVSPTLRYPDGDYLWRVQALDASGHFLPYSGTGHFSVDRDHPSIRSVSPQRGVSPVAAFTVTFSEPVTGVSASSLTLSPAVPATVVVTSPTTATLRPTTPLAAGASYQVLAGPAIIDIAGISATAAGPRISVPALFDDTSPGLTYSGHWVRLRSTNAYGGTYHRSLPTPSAPTAISATFAGNGLVIGGCAGPANGFVDIVVDGVRRVHVDTYRSYSGCGLILARLAHLGTGIHTVEFRGLGTRRAASHGTAVGFDALRAVA